MTNRPFKAQSSKHKAQRWRLALAIASFATCSLAPSQPVLAIDVEQVIWGYDGQAVAGRFNPVSIEFSNPASQPFDGVVALRRSAAGIGAATGAPIVQQVYAGPFERSRWVQFYAYVPNEWETWHLRWRGGEFELPKPIQRERAEPVRILLFDADAPSRRSGSMRQFPGHLFPPMVTATETLDVAVLGHVPRWQEPRQRAFREWLARGGTLHLVTDDTGQFPQFPEPLAELNQPLERFHVGRGLVVRHQQTAAQVDSEFVKTAIEPTINPALGKPPRQPVEAADAAAAQELAPGLTVTVEDHAYYGLDRREFVNAAFGELKELTRPDHNWPLIYLLALVYITCIFPGCYVLGLKRLDYRAVFGAILGVVVLFSVAFATVGRRGYGEATAVNTVAIAQALPDGQWDVTGWSNAFVTAGDTYRIAHPGGGVLYSTAQSEEAVAGHIINGPGAELVADIPAFSSRTFVYRTKIELPSAAVRVAEWDPGGDAQRIVIVAEGPLATPFARVDPQTVDPNEYEYPVEETATPITASEAWPAYAIYGGSFYTLDREEPGRWVLRTDGGNPLSTYAETLLIQLPQRHTWWGNQEQLPAEQRYLELQIPLVVQSLNLTRPDDLKMYVLPDDRVRLFLIAPLPAEFNIDNPLLGRQAGQVVFTLDVLRPESER